VTPGRRTAAGALALAVLAVVLADDAAEPLRYTHHRSPLLLATAGALAAALLVLAPRIQSNVVAVGAGTAGGGALATLISGVAWGSVPDPLVRGGIAFNLADVAIAAGDALLVVAVLIHGWQHRGRLRERV
jgi:lipoprotein signal peptidase